MRINMSYPCLQIDSRQTSNSAINIWQGGAFYSIPVPCWLPRRMCSPCTKCLSVRYQMDVMAYYIVTVTGRSLQGNISSCFSLSV